MARGATERSNQRVALDRLVDGPGLSQQIHFAVAMDVLGSLFYPMASGPGALAKTRPVSGTAAQSCLHAACDHLELAARLDHRQACRSARRRRKNLVAYVEVFF